MPAPKPSESGYLPVCDKCGEFYKGDTCTCPNWEGFGRAVVDQIIHGPGMEANDLIQLGQEHRVLTEECAKNYK